MSRVWLAYLYAMQDKLEEAEKVAFQAPQHTRSERAELLSLVSYYIIYGDKTSADRIAKILQENHNDEYLEFDLQAAYETDLKFPVSLMKSSVEIPESLVLENYPNPFNPSTTIQFHLAESDVVTLQIFDVLGRQVRTLVERKISAGSHSFKWDGKNSFGVDVAAGLYFANLKVTNNVKTIKLLLVR